MKYKQGTNLLTPRQRKWIEGEARGAFRKMEGAGATDETYNDWRVREAIKACGFRISEAPRAAFDDLLSHFEALNGKPEKALERQLGPGNDWNAGSTRSSRSSTASRPRCRSPMRTRSARTTTKVCP
jgi:hypothetical protein